MNAAGLDVDSLALPGQLGLLIEAVAADLHARVEPGIDLEFILEDEIRIIATGAEEGVRGVQRRGADDRTIFDFVFGLAAALDPAVQIFAVEQVGPVFSSHGRTASRDDHK